MHRDAAVARRARRARRRRASSLMGKKPAPRDDARDAPSNAPRVSHTGVKDLAKFKRKKFGVDPAACTMFIRQWSWKREMKSDKERFEDEYTYPSTSGSTRITLRQARYEAGRAHGFASTVWDSAVVLAKYLERARPRVGNALELGAGCGLVSCVLSAICGVPNVVATDLEGNVPLLRENAAKNAPSATTRALRWGEDAADILPKGATSFDLIVASDVVYVEELVPDLVRTLTRFSEPRKTRVVFAYGRNRQALETFLKCASEAGFSAPRQISKTEECDELWTCTDVDLIEFHRVT